MISSHFLFVTFHPIPSSRRLNICSGTAVRFEPSESKTISLIPIGGNQIIHGGNGLVDGPVGSVGNPPPEFIEKITTLGFCNITQPQPQTSESDLSPATMSKDTYAKTFGPTVGDCVRLGDTDLVITVEKDLCAPNEQYGEELKFGGGKVLRDGLGQSSTLPAASCVDVIITNALILDYTGIYKADVGIKGGKIVGIGKGGNPDTMVRYQCI